MSQSNNSSSTASTIFISAQAMALRAIEETLTEEERAKAAKEAIALLEDALLKGLEGRQEIIAHAQIADMLLHPRSEIFIKIGEIGIEALPEATRALAEFDKALELDAIAGALLFGNASDREGYFPLIESLWFAHSKYLSNTFPDSVEAYSFLKEKIKKLKYLKGSYLPDICFEIGYIAQEQDIAGVSPADWFRKSIEAEDYGPDSPYYEQYQKTKNLAKKNLPQAKESKCFIATAVYGNPNSVKVIGLREFRDIILLPTRTGKKVITYYYILSPSVASYISKSSTGRLFIMILVLNPLYYLSKGILKIHSLFKQ